MSLNIVDLLKKLVDVKASDLHISANTPPKFRIDELLVDASETVLSPDDSKRLAYSLLTKEQIIKFENDKELDLSYEIEGVSRYRVNVFVQRGKIGASIRIIPYSIMQFDEIGIPSNIAENFCRKPKGLVLITGATGMGKSTTLASMIDFINREKKCHIITVEDPIEFVHENKLAVIDQREVYYDTHSFGSALKHVLRQDPDVILIGEMRDLETVENALIIAETGHLVFATLHTSDSAQTINRIIDVFPSHQQQQIRTQLSFVLVGAISQLLIPRTNTSGRVLATEIMVVTPAIRALIREQKVHQIYSAIQTGQKEGMKTMNQALAELIKKGTISEEDGYARTLDPEELSKILKR